MLLLVFSLSYSVIRLYEHKYWRLLVYSFVNWLIMLFYYLKLLSVHAFFFLSYNAATLTVFCYTWHSTCSQYNNFLLSYIDTLLSVRCCNYLFSLLLFSKNEFILVWWKYYKIKGTATLWYYKICKQIIKHSRFQATDISLYQEVFSPKFIHYHNLDLGFPTVVSSWDNS